MNAVYIGFSQAEIDEIRTTFMQAVRFLRTGIESGDIDHREVHAVQSAIEIVQCFSHCGGVRPDKEESE